jgi:hypothetical protein
VDGRGVLLSLAVIAEPAGMLSCSWALYWASVFKRAAPPRRRHTQLELKRDPQKKGWALARRSRTRWRDSYRKLLMCCEKLERSVLVLNHLLHLPWRSTLAFWEDQTWKRPLQSSAE